jgi:hypothetical protein
LQFVGHCVSFSEMARITAEIFFCGCVGFRNHP